MADSANSTTVPDRPEGDDQSLVKVLLDHYDEPICHLRDCIVAIDTIARATNGSGLDAEEMPGLQFLSDAAMQLVNKVQANANKVLDRVKEGRL